MTIYTSHLPPLPIAEESIFTNLFSLTYTKHPETHSAFIDATTGYTVTRGQLKDLSLQFAHALRHELPNLGLVPLKRGDAAMIFSPNSVAWPVMLFGGFAAGVTMTLANSAYTAKELEYQWKDSGAKLVLVHPMLLPVVLEMFKNMGKEKEIKSRVVLADWGLPSGSTASSASGLVGVTSLLGRGSLKQEESFSGKACHETALLCYSSGTTGKPKGVETTHKNVNTVVAIVAPNFPPVDPSKDVMIGFLPFYHIYGCVKLLMFCFVMGMPVVVMSKFDPVEFCSSIEKYKVTCGLIVPPICLAIIHHPATMKYNLKSLRFFTSGAAPLSNTLSQACQAKLKSVGAVVYITQGYGLTETSPTTHLLTVEDSVHNPGSIGKLLCNLEARLVNDDVNEAKEGESGELWIRGTNVMKGYLNNVEATTNSITPDGWFKTGDIAIRDKDGLYYIVDRRKELIKYKGFQVPPAELEAVLLQHPLIVDAAVIGVNSEKDATELPRAYVVHAKGVKDAAAKAFGKEVQKWVESRVAKHKFLRGGVVVIDAVPKSAAGKILRRELRERAKQEVLLEPEIFGKRAKL